MSKEKKSSQLKVTLVKSINKCLKNHKSCVKGLGLRRIGQTVQVANTKENQGMISQVAYLLKVEEI
jgi:large subunit ribosomal protein L30